jgi:hypothetical protein
MKPGSLVLCIKGHPGILEEGAIYTVKDIVQHPKGKIPGVYLYEVDPPLGKLGFRIERFIEIQGPDEINANEIVHNIIKETAEV